ncbi:hypothetical protein HA402_009227 [Bradysia odoriphaga]|nr:hypothetical protein HA402_009227 [Bradysia odoriphaga]
MRNLLDDLEKVSPVGMKWILKSHFNIDVVVNEDSALNDALIDSVDIAHFILSPEFDKTSDKTKFLKEKMKLNADTILEISKITKGQASNVDWFVIRKNRITANHVDLSGVKVIQWGFTHEKDGLETLQKILNTEISSCGIFLSESGVLGASPDGYIDEDYVVEVKCPYKYRKLLLSDALKNEN